MTSPRPTETQVGTTLQQLWRIAHADTDAYHLLAHLVSHYAWLLDEIRAAEDGRGFCHGGADLVQVFSVAGGGDLEGRLYDPLLRSARKRKRDWLAGLRQLGSCWSEDARNLTRNADRRVM